MPLRTWQRARWAAASAVLAVAAVSIGTGCSSQSEPPENTASTAAPSPTEDGAERDAREGALRAYNGFRQAQVAAAAKADVTGGDLPTFTAEPLLTELKLDLLRKKQQGLVAKGKPSWSPQVTKVSTDVQPATVEIEDCFDQSGWDIVRKDTGKSVVAPGQSTRYLVVSKAVRYDDGRWLVSSARAERQRPC